MRRYATWSILASIITLGLAGGCDDFPKDPQDTLGDVRGGTMRVGVSEAKPWVWREGEEPRGVEADLVRELADELGAQVEWVWGSQDEHLAALEHWQLDLVIGGLTQATPWSKRIGMSRPFVTYGVMIGFPRGIEVPLSFEGLEIAVPWGSPLSSRVERIGAEPVATRDWWQKGPQLQQPAAAADWAIRAWGMTNSGVELKQEKHVMAVPPGENGWLVYIEQFLHAREPDIPLRLEAAVRELAQDPATAPASAATAPATRTGAGEGP